MSSIARTPAGSAVTTEPATALAAPERHARSVAGDAVLRAALDEERGRTTALRRELDDARVALASAGSEAEALGRHRDIWADRSSQLRTSLKEAREALKSVGAERDALRERVASQDGEAHRLRVHRDIWAGRARALAAALCREPTEDGEGSRGWQTIATSGGASPSAMG